MIEVLIVLSMFWIIASVAFTVYVFVAKPR